MVPHVDQSYTNMHIVCSEASRESGVISLASEPENTYLSISSHFDPLTPCAVPLPISRNHHHIVSYKHRRDLLRSIAIHQITRALSRNRRPALFLSPYFTNFFYHVGLPVAEFDVRQHSSICSSGRLLRRRSSFIECVREGLDGMVQSIRIKSVGNRRYEFLDARGKS